MLQGATQKHGGASASLHSRTDLETLTRTSQVDSRSLSVETSCPSRGDLNFSNSASGWRGGGPAAERELEKALVRDHGTRCEGVERAPGGQWGSSVFVKSIGEYEQR